MPWLRWLSLVSHARQCETGGVQSVTGQVVPQVQGAAQEMTCFEISRTVLNFQGKVNFLYTEINVTACHY